ncbi:pentatricopeptide repeat-containing protein, partial [Tanacetum coccineum]
MSTTFFNPPPPPPTTIPELHQTHAHLIKTGLIHHPFTAGHLISAAVSLKTLTYPHTMTSLTLFKDMLVDDNVVPDNYTYTFVLKACANVGCVSVGEQVYGHVVKTGVDGDLYICNTLIHFFAKNGEFGDARKVLDEMCVKDVVSWNAVLSVYCEMGMMEDAREFFGEMGVRNVESWNFMVSGYVKEGMMKEARRLFDEMGVKDVVSWNVMITGYARNGEFDEVFRLFEDMRKDGVVPDDYTFVNVLSCCASVSGLSQGEWI